MHWYILETIFKTIKHEKVLMFYALVHIIMWIYYEQEVHTYVCVKACSVKFKIKELKAVMCILQFENRKYIYEALKYFKML